MAYADIVEMARSQSLMSRVAACAAAEGIDNPQDWAMQRAWKVAASAGWADKWTYAVDTYKADFNPDTGARPDVISDADILSAVQTIRTAETGA